MSNYRFPPDPAELAVPGPGEDAAAFGYILRQAARFPGETADLVAGTFWRIYERGWW